MDYKKHFHANHQTWFNSLISSSPETYQFLPRMSKETLEDVFRIRAINEDLQRRRAEEEERKAIEVAEANNIDPAVVTAASEAAATEDKGDESDDEEIVSPVKNTQSAKITLFMPSKKEDADESLFTKYG